MTVEAQTHHEPWSDIEVRAMLDALPVLVSYVDAEQRYRFNNAAYRRWFGTPAEGEHIADVLGPTAYRGVRPYLEAALAGEHVTFEQKVPYAAGGTRWVLADYVPHRGPDGSVLGLFALVRDISERKRAQRAIVDVDSALRRIHAITSDPDLDTEGRLRAFLDFGCARFGLPVGIISRIDGDDYRIVSALDPSGHVKEGDHYPLDHTYCSETIRRSEPLHFDSVAHSDLHGHPAFDASRLHAYIGVAVHVRGQVYGTLCFAGPDPRPEPFTSTDDELIKLMAEWVGTQIQREEDRARLQQAEKMEAVGRLASGIAHDFNNVLMGILGTADLTLSKAADDAELRELLRRIKDAASSGWSITRQLLTFGRRSEGEAAAAALDEVVNETRQLLVHLAGEHMELRTDLHADGVWVACDRGRIQQILMNLVANARDAMPRGGRVAIATRLITADEARALGRPEEHAVLCVSDAGHGLDEPTLARVFEPFFTTKHKGDGTGLGLATVYGIVRGAGGDVQIRSELGHGTTVEVYLPRTAPPREAHEPALASEDPYATGTVLVVEDQADVREAVKHYLEQAGYDVLVAEDATSALELCSEMRIDVLLTDVMLPGMQGDQLAREVERLQRRVATVYMSAHAAERLEREERLPRGARALQKPFERLELLAAVRDARTHRTTRRRPMPDETVVLLVEDHEVSRVAMRELLEAEGYRVRDAATARAALELVDGASILVSDLLLPDMDGFALAREARRRAPGLPALFLSGRDPDTEEARRALAEPRTTFITKPVELAELLERLEELLGMGGGS